MIEIFIKISKFVWPLIVWFSTGSKKGKLFVINRHQPLDQLFFGLLVVTSMAANVLLVSALIKLLPEMAKYKEMCQPFQCRLENIKVIMERNHDLEYIMRSNGTGTEPSSPPDAPKQPNVPALPPTNNQSDAKRYSKTLNEFTQMQ